ncbi:hypothetical protein [Halorubrum tebenquichense]|uniref:Uncharacterized protein n=1 Tax=Halorubrum tebenquichense DSM 14210 TaxID=1227485 RepID=M0E264_9EURY|nr:hypothetical protein [Halorubrum tebenquichense]ELZ41881.1 hypothetical protein C472_00519 [Halorubrum tebenquichense DSM 14210]
MLSNDELAGLGVGLSVGAGAALISPGVGIGIGVYGVGAILVAIWRDRRERDDSDTDEVATDGGTMPRDPPQEAAPEQPAVLDVEVEGDRVLGSAERGDVSLVVEAPAGISEEELEATLNDLPERMTRTAALFDGGDD